MMEGIFPIFLFIEVYLFLNFRDSSHNVLFYYDEKNISDTALS